VFHTNRWAAAFINISGDKAEEELTFLKILAPAVKTVPGALFGRYAAKQLENILLESISPDPAGTEPYGPAVRLGRGSPPTYSIRFICLLVEKNLFRYIDLIIAGIEKMIDEQKGIPEVTVEMAFPIDNAFEKELKTMICGKIGCENIKLKSSVVPELLAGYRLRIGGLCIDASLRNQLEKLPAYLTEGEMIRQSGQEN